MSSTPRPNIRPNIPTSSNPPSSDPASSIKAPGSEELDPMESFFALIETQRQELEESMGFWSAAPSRGHWRFLVSLMGERAGLFKDRQVAQISWDNASAQRMACKAVGLADHQLPEWASSEGIMSLLALRFLFASSDLMSSGWAEAPGSHEKPERKASETNTARALISPEGSTKEELALSAAQSFYLLKAWGDSSGAQFKFNAVEPKAGALNLDEVQKMALSMSSAIDLSELPRRIFKDSNAATETPTLSLTRPDGSRYQAVADLRSAARAMGCPLELSLCAPEYKTLLCWDRIQSFMEKLNRESPAEFEARFSPCVCEKVAGSDPLATLAAREEAEQISNSAAKASSPSRPRPL